MFPDITRDDIFRIETERMWLRWLRASDAPLVTAIAGLPEVAEVTCAIPHPYPAGEAERFILNGRAATAAGTALVLAATLKSKGRTLIGFVSAQAAAGRHVELDHLIAPAHGRKGFASEAIEALVETILNLTEARIITATSRAGDTPSARVLETCGFRLVETEQRDLPARGGRFACDIYRLDRRDRVMHTPAKLPPMALQERPVDRDGSKPRS